MEKIKQTALLLISIVCLIVMSFSSSGALCIENDAPSTPIVEGPQNGNVGTQYEYEATSYVDDGDEIEYYFDWGDGNFTVWTPSLPSGETCVRSYTWYEEGTYIVKVKARDVSHHEESDWGTLEVTMPVNVQVQAYQQSAHVQGQQVQNLE